MSARMAPTVRFFWEHAGYSYGAGETRAQGRRRCAEALAEAEVYAADHGWHCDWVPDDDDMADGDTTPKERYGCILYDADGVVLESLWSIGDPDRHSRRVVEAELALEVMPDTVARVAGVVTA